MKMEEKQHIQQEENVARKMAFYKRPDLIGAVLGAIGGYIYYIEIGCNSGTCPLTSNPWFTVAWGAVLGYLVGDLFAKKKSSSR